MKKLLLGLGAATAALAPIAAVVACSKDEVKTYANPFASAISTSELADKDSTGQGGQGTGKIAQVITNSAATKAMIAKLKTLVAIGTTGKRTYFGGNTDLKGLITTMIGADNTHSATSINPRTETAADISEDTLAGKFTTVKYYADKKDNVITFGEVVSTTEVRYLFTITVT